MVGSRLVVGEWVFLLCTEVLCCCVLRTAVLPYYGVGGWIGSWVCPWVRLLFCTQFFPRLHRPRPGIARRDTSPS